MNLPDTSKNHVPAGTDIARIVCEIMDRSHLRNPQHSAALYKFLPTVKLYGLHTPESLNHIGVQFNQVSGLRECILDITVDLMVEWGGECMPNCAAILTGYLMCISGDPGASLLGNEAAKTLQITREDLSLLFSANPWLYAVLLCARHYKETTFFNHILSQQ